MRKNTDYTFRYANENISKNFAKTLFLHNDVAKLKFVDKHFFNMTFMLLMLIEAHPDTTSLTIKFSDVKELSNFTATSVVKPNQVVKLIEKYKSYTTNPVPILNISSSEDTNKKIKIFDNIDIDIGAQLITFYLSDESEYLLVRNKDSVDGGFFVMSGFHMLDGEPEYVNRLFLTLYIYKNISELKISKDKLVELCGLNKNARPGYVIDYVIVPALKKYNLYFSTGSYYSIKTGKTIEAFAFKWVASHTRQLSLPINEELSARQSKTKFSPNFKSNENYIIDMYSDEFYYIWFYCYELLPKILEAKKMSKKDINSGIFIGIIHLIENNYKCKFTNAEELSKYYDTIR